MNAAMRRATITALLFIVGSVTACPAPYSPEDTDTATTAASTSAGASAGETSAGESETGTLLPDGTHCAPGFTCWPDPDNAVVWVMKDDGNVNGPTCKSVCEDALAENCEFNACDHGRAVAYTDLASFAPVADGLGFACKEGGCWWPEAPATGLYLVSIDTDEQGHKSCFFPTEDQLSCDTHPGNANCFGERYAAVCPCAPKALDQACEWECPPHNAALATWDTDGTSCVERINYWRKRACEEGWVECPPAGLPPMVECTACHECANSEAQFDSENGAHASFGRCGESVQGEGGGATCADVIDAFVSERAPDENGIMRCQGHCGPIVARGCQTFFWGKAKDSNFHTLNWRSCNVEKCQGYCDENPGDCFTHESSPDGACADPGMSEPNPDIMACQ